MRHPFLFPIVSALVFASGACSSAQSTNVSAAAPTSTTTGIPPYSPTSGEYNVTTATGDRMVYEIPAGPRVVVGYWDGGTGVDTRTWTQEQKDGLAASRTADFEISYPYPVDDTMCFAWQHYVPDGSLHANAAYKISYDGTTLAFTQWSTLDCTATDQNKGSPKTVSTGVQADFPVNLVSRILRVDG